MASGAGPLAGATAARGALGTNDANRSTFKLPTVSWTCWVVSTYTMAAVPSCRLYNHGVERARPAVPIDTAFPSGVPVTRVTPDWPEGRYAARCVPLEPGKPRTAEKLPPMPPVGIQDHP